MAKDKQYWTRLSERYFEAETSIEEERELRLFAAETADPDFRELQAVMGLTAMARHEQRHRKQRSMRTTSYAKRYAAVAASVLLVLGLSILVTRQTRSDGVCIAYVNGMKVTEEEQVMTLMRNTMLQMDAGNEATDIVNEQMKMMFENDN